MEGLPTMMAVAESGEAVTLQQDGLTFAVSEGNGLNYAYIIHLPVDAMQVHEQILVNNVLDQENLIVEAKHHDNINFTEQSFAEIASNSAMVVPATNNNASDEVVSLSAISAMAPSTIAASGEIAGAQHANSPDVQSHPIEMHYLQEMPPFLHEGQKCDVDNFLQVGQEQMDTSKVDVKYEPVTFENTDMLTNTDVVTEPSDQTNISPSFDRTVIKEDFPCDTNNVSSCKNTAEEQVRLPGKNKKLVKANCSSTSNKFKTYGKSKPINAAPVVDLLLAKTSPPKSSSKGNDFPSNPSPPRFTKIIRITEVQMKQLERVTIPIPIPPLRKRRLIIDAQKQIPVLEFKRQLVNTKDIVHIRSEPAPGTKQALKCLTVGGVAQFFSSPGRPIHNPHLSKLFTNHLVMVTNSENCPPTSNNVPLSADLRIPSISKTEEHDPSCVNSSSTTKLTAPPVKRLINTSRPLEHLFRGLRRHPILKQYKRIQRKSTTPNGATKSFHSRHGAKRDNRVVAGGDSVTNVELPLITRDDAKFNVEEVVYTLEEGESVVLKSCGVIESEPSNSDQGYNLDELSMGTSINLEAIKSEKDEACLSSDDLEENGPKNKTDMQFATNYMDYYDDSYSLVVKDAVGKGIDLQSENDLKLWSDDASNS